MKMWNVDGTVRQPRPCHTSETAFKYQQTEEHYLESIQPTRRKMTFLLVLDWECVTSLAALFCITWSALISNLSQPPNTGRQ